MKLIHIFLTLIVNYSHAISLNEIEKRQIEIFQEKAPLDLKRHKMQTLMRIKKEVILGKDSDYAEFYLRLMFQTTACKKSLK